MTSEIRLVQEIEKHECLYNTTLPEYNRKDPSDAAWAMISQNIELTVTECKEKWRNIRCSLLRSLKPSEKVKKPYYLAPYLHFVVPFMKTINQADYHEDIHNVDPRLGNILVTVKTEEENIPDPINDDLSDEELHFPLIDRVQPKPILEKQRHSLGKNKFKKIKPKKSLDIQTYNTVIDTPKSNNESMKYFLMSLLPEFETMNEDQSRVFKIKVMILIDEIKKNCNDTSMKQNMPTSESDRLKRRLINLLIKNLKK